LSSRAPSQAIAVLTIIGAAALLCSCTSLAASSGYRQPQPYYLADDLRLPLLDTALLGAPLDLAQHIKGSYGGKVYFLDAYSKAGPEGVDMVGLDAMGTEVFDLSYSKAKGIRFSSALGMSGVKPEYVVADFQIAYYPFEAVKVALAPYGLDFEEIESGGREAKVLTRSGREILRVESLPKGLRYANALRGYSYEVTESE
jgi:hypothetical protein